jgi:DNA-directed RNA polymerase specialized sigma24 family protein
MSPLTLRRYRAERLLRQEFEALRGRVISAVRGRLLASGVGLDQSDLDACYGQAWQGLYTAVLDGHQIANPAGWLVLVTFRRAIEEHRARRRAAGATDGQAARSQDAGGAAGVPQPQAEERDLAAELDDRIRLRQLFEGMRGRLNARELQAATLCYLHGLTRSEAATRMGLSEARMRKLMEGQGAERPGVASKVGALVETIRAGCWCAEQASLMRGYAYGILDPDGERYRLALTHRNECPSCRAYVTSLRGLAAALPPVFPPLPLAAGLVAGAGAQAAPGIGGALSASSAVGAGGAAGAGGAGGGWALVGGSLGAKIAAGCVLAFGVGAGCVALGTGADHGRVPMRRSERAQSTPERALPSVGAVMARRGGRSTHAVAPPVSSPALAPARPAGSPVGEFGPEQGPQARGAPRQPAPATAPVGSAAYAAGSTAAAGAAPSAAVAARRSGAPAGIGQSPPGVGAAAAAPAAQREFGPG